MKYDVKVWYKPGYPDEEELVTHETDWSSDLALASYLMTLLNTKDCVKFKVKKIQ